MRSSHGLFRLTLLLGSVLAPIAAKAGPIDPYAKAVLDAALAASGGAAWATLPSLIETDTVAMGGMTGTAGTTIDQQNGRYSQHFTLGPATGAEGFDGTMAWTVDASGEPRIEQGGDARTGAVNDAYRNSLAYWFPDRHAATIVRAGSKTEAGKTYDIVRITPAGGRPFDFWVDQSTHFITRLVEQQENDLQTTSFSDFRAIGGVMLPYTARVSNGDPKYDQVMQVTSLTLAHDVPAATYAMPGRPAADFAFPPGKTSVTIPFHLINNHIYLDATINGHPARMMFDTGATNVLATANVRAFGLTQTGTLPGAGVGEKKQDVGLTAVPMISIGGLTIKNQIFAAFDLGSFKAVEGVAQSGLLGYEVARRVVVTIDYAAERMSFTLPSTFNPAADLPKTAIAVPFVFNEHLPQVEGSIDGIPGKFDIDTGSRATIDVPTPFVQAHKLAEKYKAGPPIITGWGVGGPARSSPVRAGEMSLGKVVIAHPLIELSTQTKGAFATPYMAGNVGSGILKRYTLTLDYTHQILYFAANAHASDPFVFDRAGMWLVLNGTGNAAKVVEVAPNTPAAVAGIVAGDTIASIDGVSVGKLTLPVVRQRLRGASGTKLHMSLQRAGGARNVTVTLAEII